MANVPHLPHNGKPGGPRVARRSVRRQCLTVHLRLQDHCAELSRVEALLERIQEVQLPAPSAGLSADVLQAIVRNIARDADVTMETLLRDIGVWLMWMKEVSDDEAAPAA